MIKKVPEPSDPAFNSDMSCRLFHSGVKVKNLWFYALQYHLEHNVIKKRDRDRLDDELDYILKKKG